MCSGLHGCRAVMRLQLVRRHLGRGARRNGQVRHQPATDPTNQGMSQAWGVRFCPADSARSALVVLSNAASSGCWCGASGVAPVGTDDTLSSRIRRRVDGRSALPTFEVTDRNAAAVLEVCRRLDSLPLAIELAAARVKLLSVEQIADRLADRFRLLVGGSRSAPARQQTLRATVDWSHGTAGRG